MFTKELRFCLFCMIYENQLLPDINSDVIDYDAILESILTEYKSFLGENVKAEDLQTHYEMYLKNQTKYENILKVHLPNWDKTFDILKAVLLAFQVEKKALKKFDRDEFVVSYIKFAEDYCVSSTVKMIHAVLSKVVDEK